MSVEDEVGMFKTFFDVILIVFNIFGGIALAAASIGIINTLFMAVQEHTREIGLDKALGMSNGKVFLSFSAEAIMLGFWGSALGIAVSYVVGQLANNVASQTFTKDFPTFKLAIFEPATMISIALIIMFIAFLAGTLPARRASKKNPIDALRYE
jgi:putative ABC transport system permease protein